MKRFQRTLEIVLPIIVLLYLGLMFYLATSSSLPDISPIENFDKYVHLIEFFFLIILLLFTIAVYGFMDYYLLSFATVLVLVVVSELIQLPLVDRSFSVKDIVADLLGVALGYLIMYGVDKKWNFLKQFS